MSRLRQGRSVARRAQTGACMEWNDDRVAALTRLWKEGFSAAQVARQLGGVSRSAVIGKIHRLGIAGREAPSRPRGTSGRVAAPRTTSHGARRKTSGQGQRGPAPSSAPFEVVPTATLISLNEHGCRWPIGNPGEDAFGFCGRLRNGRGAYCQGHTPMSLSRRLAAIPAKQIDRLVGLYGDSLVARAS
jgi:GcrA cell cycle regulator